LSLAGIPPTAGFIGKLYIFIAAIQAGHAELAVIGVLASAVSAFYYLRVIVVMYMRESAEGATMLPRLSAPMYTLFGLCALGTLAFGIVPSLILRVAQASTGLISLP